MLIDYNMSKDYCSDWTAIDAIREIVQNALDSGKKYECDADKYEIDVITYDTVLTPQVFSMGVSQKDGKNAIGKYGEGFKIVMLVLTRLNLNPVIFTGDLIVKGLFKQHEFTGIETFCLEIHKEQSPTKDTQFICKGEGIDISELEAKVTPFNKEPMKIPDNINIIQNRPGEVFVNGLYVAKEDLVFGYNFAPNKIKLNRDRNMVDGVHWQLAKYFSDLGVKHAETIFHLIERDAPDVRDLSYYLYDDKLKAELARLFYNKYGDGAKIAKPGTSYYGGSGNVSVSSSASRVYSKCGVQEAKKVADPDAPDQVLATWLNDNRKKLRRDVRNSLDTVITRSKGWRKADIL
jgi:hypothetical protein